MKQIALCFSAFRSEGRVKHPVPLRREPLLRFSDPSREMGEAALWAWGQRGRPYALLTMELYGGSDRGEAAERWGFEFIMLGDEPLEVEGSNHVRSMRSTNAGQSRPVLSDRIHWSPRGPGLTFRDMPDAPPPAQTAEARLVQMKDLIGRFSATAHRRPIPLRQIEDPIDRYSNAGAGQVDGAILLIHHRHQQP